ncbi:hypothetical protein AWB68_07315 [Caballeronia choica]|uniref:Uncharacterized protein n=1 Tax=Caballeronia choica TaxID=326476 RepID=A0A158KV34_9BURK|nr:DUF3564 family protein [Caballeronia choica]SAL84470.1 hypothetical protein AWB68_07315 [Caballeronia choica]
MRITVKLDGFGPLTSAAYAILWLDRETLRWSREGHDALDLPDWGTLQSSPIGTLICGAHDMGPIFVLKQLRIDAFAPRNSETAPEISSGSTQGVAEYYASGSKAAQKGHWHVQCIDRETIQAEHEVFSDEQDPESDGGSDVGARGAYRT